MCKKCCKIVSKNYRVENLGKKQACFACADEYGTKLTRMDDEDSVLSRSRTSSASSSTSFSPLSQVTIILSASTQEQHILTFLQPLCEHFRRSRDTSHRDQQPGLHGGVPGALHGSQEQSVDERARPQTAAAPQHAAPRRDAAPAEPDPRRARANPSGRWQPHRVPQERADPARGSEPTRGLPETGARPVRDRKTHEGHLGAGLQHVRARPGANSDTGETAASSLDTRGRGRARSFLSKQLQVGSRTEYARFM